MGDPETREGKPGRRRPVWQVALGVGGLVVAGALLLTGLVVAGGAVLVVVAMGSYGSNK